MKEETTLLLDGDIIAYKFALACQETIRWGDGLETTRIIEDEEKIKLSMVHYIQELEQKLGATRSIACISHEDNFRKHILPTYKANRSNIKKPLLLNVFKDYLSNAYTGYKRPKLEADDVMGILSTSNIIKGKKIIVSEDKDMQSIPGLLYNPRKDDKPRLISTHQADSYHLLQTLTGDPVDGYTGCKGIGKVKADKYLGELNEWFTVKWVYQMKGFTEEDALVQARVARICRYEDYDFDKKEVILWTPKVI